MSEVSPEMKGKLDNLLTGEQFPVNSVPHCELQKIAEDAKVIIRTGEFTPYCNIVLIAGVLF